MHIKLLYITREKFPVFRVDITHLFGKVLPKYGIQTSIIAEKDIQSFDTNTIWASLPNILFSVPKIPLFRRVIKPLITIWLSIKHIKFYEAVQVRDLAFVGFCLRIISLIAKKPFFFMCSYLFSESDLYRARKEKLGIIKKLVLNIRGIVNAIVLYRILFPFCSHIFVQSNEMKKYFNERYGIPKNKMTPIPMGIDEDYVTKFCMQNSDGHLNAFHNEKKFIAYIGEISIIRRIDLIIDAISELVQSGYSNLHLLLIGGPPEGQNLWWLDELLVKKNLKQKVTVTGWKPRKEAWDYLKNADIGISIFPRNIIFDTSTPTKIIEYAALGIPIIVSDNPDQKEFVENLRCGLSISFNKEAIKEAIKYLLENEDVRIEMGRNGKGNVLKYRGYNIIAQNLAEKYKSILEK